MPRSILLFFSLISANFAFGQLDSNSVTVTVSNNTTIRPDQAVFVVSVTSDIETTLADVLAAVQPAGLTMANFSGVTAGIVFISGPQRRQNLRWDFSMAAPLADTNSTIAALTALQQSIHRLNGGLSFSFAMQGIQVSTQALQSQTCDFAALLNQARTKAQDLAATGGRTISGIAALSTSASTIVGALPPGLGIPPPCSATVKFALLGSN